MIKTLNASPAINCAGVIRIELSVAVQAILGGLNAGLVAVPNAWVLLKPAFEIAAPKNLLDEFHGRRRAVPRKRSCQHFLLSDQPVSDPRGQRRDLAAVIRAQIIIALRCVMRASARGELFHPCKPRAAGRFKRYLF